MEVMYMTHGKTPKKAKLRHAEYYDMQTVFDDLYQRSSQSELFGNLMQIIAAPDNIRLAYRNIKNNTGSHTAGVDNADIKSLSLISEEEYIQRIQKQFQYYRPKPVRRVEIPKPNGKLRPLGIPCISDRLVQQCILQVLEPVCEAKFYEHSYGFRPNRSTEHAVAHCMRIMNFSKLYYVVDIDIKGFFDNVNHRKLIRQLWTMGIRDTKLLCIIKAMLKAPIVMPDGRIEYPTKGTPQGGILSPLLANIVLNELDWWIASQWEQQCDHMKKPPKPRYAENGSRHLGHEYNQLRKTRLKEMHIVRYADDFKVFCANREDAQRAFAAIQLWLKERLQLEISPEKSKVTNVKRHYCEFLGFKLKVWKKGDRYVGKSHVCEKAIKHINATLAESVKEMQHPKDRNDLYKKVGNYNAKVIGIQNYYAMATEVCSDLSRINWRIGHLMAERLQLEKEGQWQSGYLRKRFAASEQVRWVQGYALMPIGYVRFRKPISKRRSVCAYTESGRAEIHKNLKIDMRTLLWLMRNPVAQHSVEYNDNRISLFVAQGGKCAVTGRIITPINGHCHHINPRANGGNDDYFNLKWVVKEVHFLIHATKRETIDHYLENSSLTNKQLEKLNKLRIKAGNMAIEIASM